MQILQMQNNSYETTTLYTVSMHIYRKYTVSPNFKKNIYTFTNKSHQSYHS